MNYYSFTHFVYDIDLGQAKYYNSTNLVYDIDLGMGAPSLGLNPHTRHPVRAGGLGLCSNRFQPIAAGHSSNC